MSTAAKKVPTKKTPAKKHTPRGLEQDRREVAADQPYEVEYEAIKLGVKPADIRAAIKAVGNQRSDIEVYIQKKKGKS